MAESSLHRVRERHPELPDGPIRLIEDGWDFLVLDVGDEWIFRFPRRAEVQARLRAELGFLPLLAERLPVRVPVPELVDESCSYVGYRKIHERGLDAIEVPSSRLENVGRHLGEILSVLHSLPTAELSDLGMPFNATQKHVDDMQSEVLPLLAPEHGGRAQRFLEWPLIAGGATPSHADLGPDHILVDEEGQISGIIDWGDAQISDAALDFCWLLTRAPAALRRAVEFSYRPAIDDRMRAQIDHYFRLVPWHDALFWMREGNEANLSHQLEQIVRHLP